jgi:TIR domain-containing protein
MPRAFVSYARTDREIAKRLAQKLEERGISVWMEDTDIPIGANWASYITEAIKAADLFLVIVSPSSEKSEHVKGETALAISFAEKKRLIAIPVLTEPNVNAPFFFRHIQPLEFYDPDKAQRGIDQIAEILKSQREPIGADYPAQYKYLSASKAAIEEERAVQLSERARRSSQLAVWTGVLASAATLLAGFIALITQANRA